MCFSRRQAARARAVLASGIMLQGLVGVAHGQAANVTWVGLAGQGTGNWSVGTNWTGGVVPNNNVPVGTTYNVFIDADPMLFSTATLNISSTINILTLDAGDTVTQSNSTTLTIAGSAGVSDIVNSGTYILNGIATPASVTGGANNLMLTGGGTFVIGTVSRFNGSGTLTNVNNLLRGGGNIGVNDLTIINSATISADANIRIDPGLAGGMTNHGTIQANGGTVELTGNGGGAFFNNGTILALNDSTVSLITTAHVSGGLVTTVGSGIVQLPSGADGTLSNLTNGGNLASQNGTNTFLVGTITNNGTWDVNGTTLTDVEIPGAVNLSGTGVLNLNNASTRVQGGGTLTANTLIRGRGAFGSNNLTFINTGTIEAVGGTLTVDPNAGTVGGGFTNNATLRATAGATLALSGNGGGSFNNANGFIRAADGGTVSIVVTGTIVGGTLHSEGSGIVQVAASNDGTLNNVSLSGKFASQSSTNTTLVGTISNAATWDVNGASLTDIEIPGDVLLTGGGTLSLNNPSNRVQGGGTLTSDNLIHGVGTFGSNNLVIINNNIIEAVGGTLGIDPLNNGTLVAGLTNNGHLRAAGSSTLALSGNGFGFFDNSDAFITAADGGTVSLVVSALIAGGTLSTEGSGLVQVAANNDATLSNLTNVGRLASQNSTNTFLVGTIVNNGTWDVNGATLTDIEIPDVATVTGSGVMNLNNPAGRVQGSGGTLTINTTIRGAGAFGSNSIGLINNGTIEAANGVLTVDPNSGGMINTGTLRATAGGTLVLSGNAVGDITSTSGAIDVDPGGTMNTISTIVLTAAGVTLDGQWNANLGTVTLQHVRGSGTLAIASSGSNRITVNAGGGTVGTSKVGALTIAGTGRLDLTDHDLAIDYTGASPLLSVRALIQSAFTGGTWGGAGLTSSSAAAAAATADKTGLGYVEAADIGSPAMFRGVSVDATSVLVGYTLLGDATLDRTVNISDFSRLASNFNTPGPWFNGDFNYDGTTNIGDFSLLASNFNKVLAGDLPRDVVPEPGGAILLLGAAALNRRRRQHLIPG